MRYFIGIELEDELREHLGELKDKFKSEYKTVSWLDTDQLFITLQFLGRPHPKRLGYVKRAMKRIAKEVAPFSTELRSTGTFPENGPPRTIWVDVEEHSGMLQRFIKDTHDLISKENELPDFGEFKPHIVLGRLSTSNYKGKLVKDILSAKPSPLSQAVETIALVESKLDKSGPKYKVIQRCKLEATLYS